MKAQAPQVTTVIFRQDDDHNVIALLPSNHTEYTGIYCDAHVFPNDGNGTPSEIQGADYERVMENTTQVEGKSVEKPTKFLAGKYRKLDIKQQVRYSTKGA